MFGEYGVTNQEPIPRIALPKTSVFSRPTPKLQSILQSKELGCSQFPILERDVSKFKPDGTGFIPVGKSVKANKVDVEVEGTWRLMYKAGPEDDDNPNRPGMKERDEPRSPTPKNLNRNILPKNHPSPNLLRTNPNHNRTRKYPCERRMAKRSHRRQSPRVRLMIIRLVISKTWYTLGKPSYYQKRIEAPIALVKNQEI
jgi:hypothetical protein